MFTEKDLKQISEKGIEISTINKQIDNFIRGFPFVYLARPATNRDGIFSFREDDIEKYIRYFNKQISASSVIKFVPASGAASRMFKHLFEFCETYTGTPDQQEAYLKDNSFNSVHYFISHLAGIAFYNKLDEILHQHNLHAGELITSWQLDLLISFILRDKGLNYANLPKGLLLFHNYPEGARTAAEEHLVEAATYARNEDSTARIHFTISPEHREKFDELFARVKKTYESVFGVTIEISFSEQLPSTDTIAVDEENTPFRDADGKLHFRPGGHGALLKNLNRLDAEIIFVKNIDNIVPDRLRETTYKYKRVIGGYLLSVRNRIFEFLSEASQAELPEETIREIVHFARTRLFMKFPDDFETASPREKQTELMNRLNRPIRVCGMVRNEGEPGGGPFWVKGQDGNESLQIVESSQINMKDPAQQKIVNEATHFNPVDLVCSIKDFQGEPFDLMEFVDEETGFISLKSSGGRNLKAQELPGLWNGAMANWITVFVEVPIITFNPVKTVNDLLRKEHLLK